MSSELACISTNLSTAARYSSGIQSSASTLPPDPTWAKKASASPGSYARAARSAAGSYRSVPWSQRVLQDRCARRRELGGPELERGRQHLVEKHLGQRAARRGVLLTQALAARFDALRVVRQLGDDRDSMAADAQHAASGWRAARGTSARARRATSAPGPCRPVDHDPDDRRVRRARPARPTSRAARCGAPAQGEDAPPRRSPAQSCGARFSGRCQRSYASRARAVDGSAVRRAHSAIAARTGRPEEPRVRTRR